MTKLQWKWAGLLALMGLALLFLYPTLDWYSLAPAERQKREAARLRPRWLLNLGLDLKGGTHLLMELDVEKLGPEEDLADAMSRAIEIIRNRIDQFGVAEPLIARQGQRWIIVQLPGISNSEQAKQLIGKTALLEFRMVDSSEAAQKAVSKIAELGRPFDKEGKVLPEAEILVPKGTLLAPGKEDAFYLVTASAPITGAFLENARVETGGNYGLPYVAFRFNPEGGKLFGALTGANVGKNLAILLDGVVYSAPVIKSRIGNQGIIEGNFTMEECRALAIVLRAGSLPAPVRVIEERTVGPTLGEDSIRAGLTACAVGGGLVVLFMLFYYRLSGLVANLALVLNLILLLSTMAYFGATLTLPGLAGVILTIGMAVDANVLIFERIREELALQKPIRLAIEAGYEKAFSAILDSNLTTLFAAAFLFQFGTGPIKGFAVTLTLGIAASMFTAIWVTRLVFESWTSGMTMEKLSI